MVLSLTDQEEARTPVLRCEDTEVVHNDLRSQVHECEGLKVVIYPKAQR